MAQSDENKGLSISFLNLFKNKNGEQGEKGTNGLDGSIGLQGEKGDKGDTGLTGAKGDTGLTGESGIDGQNGTIQIEAYTNRDSALSSFYSNGTIIYTQDTEEFFLYFNSNFYLLAQGIFLQNKKKKKN